ncbi:hypothetical protein PIB30_033895 [Stylosanthes scabra]|uniref:Uncharacterized protein n=1 Tax=Stylosanthes scabra TaxID=79078 RepID=A0ABU6UEM8_9FABA|nr:hypothetical protein [Stylosanthes scabra]
MSQTTEVALEAIPLGDNVVQVQRMLLCVAVYCRDIQNEKNKSVFELSAQCKEFEKKVKDQEEELATLRESEKSLAENNKTLKEAEAGAEK